jgi:hypothetical protein
MTVLFLGEVLEKLNEKECMNAVRRRRDLIHNCAGTLYPSVLIDEIEHLLDRAKELRYETKQ